MVVTMMKMMMMMMKRTIIINMLIINLLKQISVTDELHLIGDKCQCLEDVWGFLEVVWECLEDVCGISG